jgi:hypothetical protein
VSASSKAEFFTLLPVALAGLVLFLIAKRGSARGWEVAAAAVAGVVLAGSFLGPQIHSILSTISMGYLH